MFNLNKIQNRISDFFQSEVRKAENPSDGSVPENADSGSDREEILAGEITALLDDGTISPETEKVKNWAVSKGLSEDAAEGFANEVISAYFDDSGSEEQGQKQEDNMTEEEVKENEDKDGAEGDDEEDEDDEVTKAALAELADMAENNRVILKGLADLTKAMEKIADKVNGIEKQVNEEIPMLKSQLGSVKSTPANIKAPVTQTQTAPSAGETPVSVIKSWVKEQFLSGNPNNIQINEVGALDSGHVSPKIKDLFLKSRGNK